MRHIKIYEEYSDGDLEDLIGDLDSIGQIKFIPKLGRDYGYTSKLLEKPEDPKSVYGIYFSPETAAFLVEDGLAFYSGFTDKKKSVGFNDKDLRSQGYGSYGPGNYIVSLSLRRVTMGSILDKNTQKILYQLVGMSGDYGFGIAGKQLGKRARNYVQENFITELNKKIKQLQ